MTLNSFAYQDRKPNAAVFQYEHNTELKWCKLFRISRKENVFFRIYLSLEGDK
ncbi:hypothetical protein TrispH2_011308 [Trichoplax sp. H2]|nr:hypothetical protein TrispH2_011308 [Trichoplax sp. H2]|eukprot:RDD37081.1 hypothetical protein TrispH2_011308 [Trichoplax sp. H2]